MIGPFSTRLCQTLSILAASGWFLAVPAFGQSGQPASPPAGAAPRLQQHSPLLALDAPWRASRSPALLAILDDYFEHEMRISPVEASTRGDERFNDQLPDLSAEGIERTLEEQRVLLSRLRAIDRASLGEADRTDADLLEYVLTRALDGARFKPEQTAVDARSGPQVWLAQMHDRLPFRTPKHYADFATRLEGIASQVDQTIAQMRAGMAAKRVPPKIVMMGVVEQARALSSKDVAETPSLSPFYAPFRGQPAGDPAAARARAAITERIIPAFARFADFVEKDYLPACRDSLGISEGIDGPPAYDFALAGHTTTALTADEIHQIGLREVARIRSEMLTVIAKTDFLKPADASPDALLAAFLKDLRTNPKFYYTKPDDLLSGYRDIAKRVDAELPKLFGTLPRLTYGVREIPAFAALTSPTAYYYSGAMESGVPGYFMANTYKLDQRPKYEMIALTMHEAVPGHHLQIALAQELKDAHPFRTLTGFTAFVEGWALYAERLGLEVGGPNASPHSPGGTGLYEDPYDDFGRLTYEMWRACRLVVDTGLHSKRWPRKQAVDFMLANTALSELNIDREVDRYIAWPGQATAYKIGELKIRELRTRAEKALGDAFDVRAFHDAVLGSGAIPLPTLEAKINRWIEARRNSGATPAPQP